MKREPSEQKRHLFHPLKLTSALLVFQENDKFKKRNEKPMLKPQIMAYARKLFSSLLWRESLEIKLWRCVGCWFTQTAKLQSKLVPFNTRRSKKGK
jgi:hypothetical protein